MTNTVYYDDSENVIGETGDATLDVASSYIPGYNINAIARVDIGSNVEAFVDVCFANCTSMTSVIFNTSKLTNISMGCFYNCIALASINIPSSVTAFSDFCFEKCSSLASVSFNGNNITFFGLNCFRSCANLTSIVIPLGVTVITEYCFEGCSSLASVSFNASSAATRLDLRCFQNCSSLTSINIPSTITSLGNNCFNGCSNLTSITVPSSVASIGNNCFAGCTSLTTINYENPGIIAGVSLSTILSGNTSPATVNFYMTSSAPNPALVNTVYYTGYYTADTTTFNYISGGMPVICLDENTLVCIDLENNYVPIKDIKSGDMVVDYSGNLVPVLFNICSGETDKFVKISKDAIGTNKPSRDIYMTKGHPVLTNGGREFPCQSLINNRNVSWNTFDKPHSVYNICTEKRIFIKMENMYVCTWAKDEYEKFITKYNVVCRGRK